MSAVGLLIAVGIFAAMVLYTVSVIRDCQWQILTGESVFVCEIISL